MTSGLVVLSLEDWDQVWRRNQYLVSGLLDLRPELRVLFVTPPADPLHDLSRRRRPRWGHRPAEPDLDRASADRLHIFRPTKLLPRRLDPHGDYRRSRAVVHTAQRLGFVRPTLWINDPNAAPILSVVDWPSLYDVTDDWLAANRPAAEHDRLVECERLLLERCDVVTVCSPALVESKGRDRPVDLITNGVDVERYGRPVPRPDDLPAGPIALYAGTLHSDRLDVATCVRTAQSLAEASGTLVLLGPDALEPAERASVESAGGILLGARPHLSVPGYLQHANVLVVPHLVDAFTDSLDPIKLYEYRAVGRPIVSTAVAGFRDSPDPLVQIRRPEDFAAAVVTAAFSNLNTTSVTRRTPPDDIPTWSRQADLMHQALRHTFA